MLVAYGKLYNLLSTNRLTDSICMIEFTPICIKQHTQTKTETASRPQRNRTCVVYYYLFFFLLFLNISK